LEGADDLIKAMKVTLNLLNDRPADFEWPHRAPMSGG
jgi:hypothetical protein